MTILENEKAAELSRRSAVAGGILLMTSAAATGLKLRQTVVPPVNMPLGNGIPDQLGKWTVAEGGRVVRPADEGAEKGPYDQEVSRIYTAPEQSPVMLLIAYGSTQSDTLQVHRPEFCYPASGFEIRPQEDLIVSTEIGRPVPSAFFTAVRGERIEQILYWTRLGDQFPTSWLRQHVSRVRNSLRGIVPDGILVRASMIEPNRDLARVTLTEFMRELVGRSSPITQRALVGRLEG